MNSKEVDEHKSSSVQQFGTVVSYFRWGEENTQFREHQLTPPPKRKWRVIVKIQGKQH